MSVEPGTSRHTPDRTVLWIGLIVFVLFAVPIVAMQFTSEVDWNAADFLVWGVLLLGAAGAFLWARRRLPRSKWWGAGAVIVALFLYVWAELAVGIFTDLGS